MKRLLVVLTGTLLMLLVTIAAVGSTTTRSVEAGGGPSITVTPLEMTVIAPISTSAVFTRSLFISVSAGTTLSWSLSISPTAEVMPVVAPITGVNSATIIVQINVNPISATGLYTAYIYLTPQAGLILGAGIMAIPVQVLAVESLHQVYLPVILHSYQALLPPPVAPPVGLDFISSVQAGRSETRYQRALAISGTLNRWPIYWNEVETQATTQPRVYNWTAVDTNLVADINHGLTVLPILMFTPAGLDTGGSHLAPIPQVGAGLRALMKPAALNRPEAPSSVTTPPQGLYLSTFSDGTDTPGSGKAINPDNRWVYFVNAAVNRYKPGGVLAQQQGWTDTRGVRYWEIWNEPDLDMFFTGTITDYARLLKVAYLSARAADPQAQIVLGGLSQAQKPSWFSNVLNVLQTDPDAVTNHYFMDKVAVHTYFWAWDTFGHLYPDRVQLDNHGLQNVALWLTEVGLPVCGDASFPACNDPQLRWFRASPDEQAAYLIQSAAYAAWLKAEAYIWFQLFDDCGNQCGVDAYGLVRNDNTTRLAYQTYPLVNAQLTNVQPYWRDRRTITATNWISGNQEIIALKRPATGERIVVMWTRYYTAATVILTSTAPSAQLYFPDGSSQTIFPISGTYAISLPLATNRNFSGTIGGTAPDGTGSAPIGGAPRILVESDPAAR